MGQAYVTRRHREMGRRARERAQKRAGSGRIPDSAWMPEIEYLTDAGLTTTQIAEVLSLSPRRVREIRQFAVEGGTVLVPDPIPLHELSPDVQACLEFSAEGFKRFYERFSGMSLPDHCYEWVDAFCKYRNLLLNVPPRHMKSSIFSLWVPVWLLCRDRNERVLLVSLTKDSAKKWVNGIAEQLTVNDQIVSTFGIFKPSRMGDVAWRPLSGTLMVVGRKQLPGVQYSVESRGQGQQILGQEATVLIVDDVTDKKIAENPEAREKQKVWLQTEVFSRIETQTTESSGRAVVIGQRVSVFDIYGELQAQKYERGPKVGEPLWKSIVTPAVLRWPDEDPDNPEPLVLWPEKWSFDELMVTYERIGGHAAFQTMYQQQPLAEGESIFKPEWWIRCYDQEREAGQGVRSSNQFLPVVRVLSIDPSVSMYHASVVADVLYDRERFVCVVIEARRWKGPQKSLIDEIERVIHVYRPDYFIFEDVSFVRWLKEDPYFVDLQKKVHTIPHQTNRNKGDEEMGVSSLAREVEFGYLRLPRKGEWAREVCRLIEEEANAWPYGTYNDVLMALWFIKWNYKRLIPVSQVHPRMRWLSGKFDKVWSGFERTKDYQYA